MTKPLTPNDLTQLRNNLRQQRQADLRQARRIRMIGMGALIALGIFGFITGNLGFGLFIMLIGYFAVKWVSGALAKQADQAASYKHDRALEAQLAPRLQVQELELTSTNVPFWRDIPRAIIPPSDEVETAGTIRVIVNGLEIEILDAQMTRRIADEPSQPVFSGAFIDCLPKNAEISPLTIRPRVSHDRNALHAPYAQMEPATEVAIASLRNYEVFCDERETAIRLLTPDLCTLLNEMPTLALHYTGQRLFAAKDQRAPTLNAIDLAQDYDDADLKGAASELSNVAKLTAQICAALRA